MNWVEGLFGENALLGLLAAMLWGAGDFSGSFAVKRTGATTRGALQVVIVGHLLSLCAVSFLAWKTGGIFPHGAPLFWGLGGGAVAGISLVAFYVALASGHMGSAAAVSGLLCAAVPATVSAFLEGVPGWKRLLGFLLAGIAIWFVASAESKEHTASRKAFWLSATGGIGFGIYFVALKLAGAAGVLWAMGTARIGSSGTCALLLILMIAKARMTHAEKVSVEDETEPEDPLATVPLRHESWHTPGTLGWIAAGAALDTGGNLSFIASTLQGRLDVAAVLASIYPASTILLASLLLKEKTSRRQKMGMLIALPAVILISA